MQVQDHSVQVPTTAQQFSTDLIGGSTVVHGCSLCMTMPMRTNGNFLLGIWPVCDELFVSNVVWVFIPASRTWNLACLR